MSPPGHGRRLGTTPARARRGGNMLRVLVRLYQIPFSHNCIKVRHVLDLKGVPHEKIDIVPLDRSRVIAASGQWLVPALVDDGQAISGSTNILLHLEREYPDPQLLPEDPRERAECLVLMDWADETFMALTRRLAYAQALSEPGTLGRLFFPRAGAHMQKLGERVGATLLRMRFGITSRRTRRDFVEARRAARVAVDRIAGRDHLVGDSLTLADITLAAMCAPLQYASAEIACDEAVTQLLTWSATILRHDFSPIATPPPAVVA